MGMSLTNTQCIAARSLLGWTNERLALEAEVSPGTIIGFEMGRRKPHAATINRIEATLEAAGIEFLDGSGVRLPL